MNPAAYREDGMETKRRSKTKKYYQGGPMNLRNALELVRDTASREWQEKDETRKGATDNEGRRMWFISAEVMDEVRLALASSEEDA